MKTNEDQVSYQQRFLKLCETVGNNNNWIVFINVLVVYSLIADYLRVLIFRSSGDVFFDVLTILVFLVFVIEIIIYLITVKNYSCSFYFFIDTISTLLLIVDVTFISNAMFYGRNVSGNNTSDLITRLGKYFRIIRLIRILKLLKDSPQIQNEENSLMEFKVQARFTLSTGHRLISRKRRRVSGRCRSTTRTVRDCL